VKAAIRTTLPVPPAKAWQMLLQRDAFLYATRGMLGFEGAEDWPATFQEGQLIETRLILFNVIPAWKHALHLVRVDHDAMEMASKEGGGLIRRWDHRKWIGEAAPNVCAYTDEIEIEAGPLTVLIWAYAHVFYRYRQWRMRRFAKRL